MRAMGILGKIGNAPELHDTPVAAVCGDLMQVTAGRTGVMKNSIGERLVLEPVLRTSDKIENARRTLGVDPLMRRSLVGGAIPLWLLASISDWWCHRRSRIEATAGLGEATLHWVLVAQSGVPVLLGLFCEANAATLAISAGTTTTHTICGYWDVAYADKRRHVSPLEQLVHVVLEAMPVVVTSSLFLLHWDQAQALIGRGPTRPDFRIRMRRPPLATPRTRSAVLLGVFAFNVVPYVEEMWRCLREHPALKARREAPF
jgi:hypothetical protein